jgi:hypothetical protein
MHGGVQGDVRLDIVDESVHHTSSSCNHTLTSDRLLRSTPLSRTSPSPFAHRSQLAQHTDQVQLESHDPDTPR